MEHFRMKSNQYAIRDANIYIAALRLAVMALALGSLAARLQAQNTNTIADTDFPALQAAAEKGDANAELALARCYAKGNGALQDYVKAASFTRRAAQQGNAAAQAQLGYFYGMGLGVDKDPAEALKWYRKAASQGDPMGQFGLGNIYAEGLGVASDPAQAVQWWQKAATQNLARAQNALGQYYLKLAMTNHANIEKYADARLWLRKAAEQGYLPSMNNLAAAYEYGLGGPKDWPEAAKWYQKAAEQGNRDAQDNLGLMYLDGRGVPCDLVQAYKWLKISFLGGNNKARPTLNELRHSGQLTTNQVAEADRLVREFGAAQKALRPVAKLSLITPDDNSNTSSTNAP